MFTTLVNGVLTVNKTFVTTSLVPGQPPPPWLLRLLRTPESLEIDLATDPGRLDVRVLGGPVVRFVVVAEPRVSEERARAIADRARGADQVRLLLATRRLSARARAILRDAGVSWVERETRRCHLAGPGLLVDTTLSAIPVDHTDADPFVDHPPRVPPALLRDRSGLLAETLLPYPRGESLRLRAVAADAGLSPALVSRLFDRLTRLGILEARGRAPNKRWTLHDPGALLDRWADEERGAPEERTGLSVWARTPADLLQRLATAMHDQQLRYAFGGITAANIHVPTLTAPSTPDLWIPAHIAARDVARALGGQVVASGANVRLWQTTDDVALRRATAHPAGPERSATDLAPLSVVSPYRAYVEARRAPGRGPDVADALRRTFDLAPSAATGDPDD